MKRLSRKLRRRFHMVLTVLVVLASHAMWILLPMRAEKPAASPIAWGQGDTFMLPSEGESRWVPVLFALPSSTGFSAALTAQEEVVPGGIGAPVDLSVLDRTPPAAPVWNASLSRGMQGNLPALNRFREVDANRDSSRGWTFQWLMEQGPEVIVFRPPIVPMQRELAVDGVIGLNDFGMVEELLLDQPDMLEPVLRRKLVQSLSGLRVPRGEGTRQPFRVVWKKGERS